jgi:hypothetical protein
MRILLILAVAVIPAIAEIPGVRLTNAGPDGVAQ